MQLDGGMNLSLYEANIELQPNPEYISFDKDELTLVNEVTLQPGDVLYLPRDIMYEGKSGYLFFYRYQLDFINCCHCLLFTV